MNEHQVAEFLANGSDEHGAVRLISTQFVMLEIERSVPMNFLPDENDLPVLLSGSQETAGMDHVLYFIIDGHAEHDRRRPAQVSYAEGMFAYDGGNSEFSIDATAFHEAGHAVVGYALGLGCGGVSISWYSENTRTQIRRQGRDSILDRAGYVARAIWSLAGAAAEYKFGRVSHRRLIPLTQVRLHIVAGRRQRSDFCSGFRAR